MSYIRIQRFRRRNAWGSFCVTSSKDFEGQSFGSQELSIGFNDADDEEDTIFLCVGSAGYLQSVFGPLCFRRSGNGVCDDLEGCVQPFVMFTALLQSIDNWIPRLEFFQVLLLSSVRARVVFFLRMCWVVACLWLTVLLRNRRSHLCSEPRIWETIVIREDVLVTTASVRSGCCVTVLVDVEAFLGKSDRKGETTVCFAGNGSSR